VFEKKKGGDQGPEAGKGLRNRGEKAGWGPVSEAKNGRRQVGACRGERE